MRIVWAGSGQPELNAFLSGWLSRHIGEGRDFGSCVSMGVLDGSRLIAVIVYHNWDPEAEVIEISGAAIDRRWLARPVLEAMFAYPFVDAGAQMAVMRVSPKNARLHRMLEAYGFDRYTLPRLRGRHEDGIVFTLTDDAWRTSKFNMRSSGGESQGARAA